MRAVCPVGHQVRSSRRSVRLFRFCDRKTSIVVRVDPLILLLLICNFDVNWNEVLILRLQYCFRKENSPPTVVEASISLPLTNECRQVNGQSVIAGCEQGNKMSSDLNDPLIIPIRQPISRNSRYANDKCSKSRKEPREPGCWNRLKWLFRGRILFRQAIGCWFVWRSSTCEREELVGFDCALLSEHLVERKHDGPVQGMIWNIRVHGNDSTFDPPCPCGLDIGSYTNKNYYLSFDERTELQWENVSC